MSNFIKFGYYTPLNTKFHGSPHSCSDSLDLLSVRIHLLYKSNIYSIEVKCQGLNQDVEPGSIACLYPRCIVTGKVKR